MRAACGNERPSCEACVKAQVTCIFPPEILGISTYNNQLEERLRLLESRISHASALDVGPSPSLPQATTGDSSQSHTRRHHRSTSTASNRFHPYPSRNRDNTASLDRQDEHSGLEGSKNNQASETTENVSTWQTEAVDLISADAMPNVGPNGTFETLASKDRVCPQNISTNEPNAERQDPPSTFQLLNRLPVNYGLDLPTLEPSLENLCPPSTRRNEVTEQRRGLPPRHHANELVHHFLEYTNSTWALVHEPTLLQQVESLYGQSPGDITDSDVFIVAIILTIACSTLVKFDKRRWTLTVTKNDCWEKAKPFIPMIPRFRGLEKLQAQHLLLQYYMLNPEDGNIWDLSGSVMRTAIDLGIHQGATSSRSREKRNCVERDMQNRLFWAAYCVDRNLASALGRPPGIPDDWVEAELPYLVHDKLITPTGVTPGPVSPHKVSVHQHINLRRMQSEIQHRLYSSTSARLPPPDEGWFEYMQGRLIDWRSKSEDSSVPVFSSPDWLDLNYQLTTSQLNRPCPGNERPSRTSLQLALKSSGDTMRLFKKMYRQGNINYSWLAVSHLFISGVTFLSSLCLAEETNVVMPNLIDAMLDIQSCSNVLEALSALQPGKSATRDAFEQISVAVIRKLSIRQSVESISSEPADLDLNRHYFVSTNTQPSAVGPDQLQTTHSQPGLQTQDYLTTPSLESDGVWDALRSFLFDPSATFGEESWDDLMDRPEFPGL